MDIREKKLISETLFFLSSRAPPSYLLPHSLRNTETEEGRDASQINFQNVASQSI